MLSPTALWPQASVRLQPRGHELSPGRIFKDDHGQRPRNVASGVGEAAQYFGYLGCVSYHQSGRRVLDAEQRRRGIPSRGASECCVSDEAVILFQAGCFHACW